MRHIPSIVVLSVLALIVASWPDVQAWSEQGAIEHYLVHALYLLSGALFGLQTASWVHKSQPIALVDEGGISS